MGVAGSYRRWWPCIDDGGEDLIMGNTTHDKAQMPKRASYLQVLNEMGLARAKMEDGRS
jgi:hypothetical protein